MQLKEVTMAEAVSAIVRRAIESYEKILQRQINSTKIPLAKQALEKELADLRSAK